MGEPDVTRQANADHQKQIREYQRRIERLDKELKVEIAHNNSTRAAIESFSSEKELKDEEIKKWKQMYSNEETSLTQQQRIKCRNGFTSRTTTAISRRPKYQHKAEAE